MNLTRRSFTGLALSVAAGCAGALLSGCEGATGGGTLRAGVRSDVTGFGYLNERTGNYYGLEIDLVVELAERLGRTSVEFVTVTPDDRKEMLLGGEIDLICACYSIADSRLENFDFSPAYYEDEVVAVVQNSSMIESLDDMRGLTFGTMSGANAAPLLSVKLYEEGFSDGEVRSANEDNSDVRFDTWHLLQFPSYQELSDALETGEVDAMVLDGAIARTYMDDKRSVLDGFVVAEQSYGIATQKDSELSAPVAEAVQAMLDDGTVAALQDKWD
ncbi:MAG TPA: transporter substrate-binding domain-containing protein [Candidatus Olsenella pullistercoris]|uniref:Transporter substrate-binding domain-containing protein n=1 Tax=Candidatus Olsenella pullistercoris TaxID=2838712 RepID=A0A9D2JE31_9ACTN|nr:transporter substrate-binding domain-containing protein [Candidatus Olsenella pullistercoris]